MAKKFTNVHTYIIILVFIGIFSVGLYHVASETANNSNANLDNDSILYLNTLQTGVTAEEIAEKYNLSKTDVEESIIVAENGTQGNPKDESLEFLLAKEEGFKIEKVIKRVFGFPSFLVGDILRLPISNWKWLIDTIVWFLFISITIAIINYIRKGAPDQ